MAKKKVIPEYGKVKKNGTEYYRTRILDADGKQGRPGLAAAGGGDLLCAAGAGGQGGNAVL